MPLWGNKDKVTVGGNYTLSATGVVGVTGATGFPTSVRSGDSIVFETSPVSEYVVKTVSGSTGMTVFVNEYGATGAKVIGSTGIFFQQKPKNLLDPERKDVYGVDTTEAAVTNGPAHAGWVEVKQGSGYVKEVVLNTTGATGYNPSVPPPVTFSAGGASGVAIVSPAGAVTGVVVTNGGVYTTTAPTVAIGSTGATGVVGTVIMGGRFNRTTFETLVAMGVPAATMGDAEDTIFPNA
jgi:hypothetical protein